MADAATEFFGQAKDFDMSLGDIAGSLAVSLVKADIQAKQANAGLIETLLVTPDGKPRPNVKAEMDFDFAKGGKSTDEARFTVDEPVFLLTDLTSFLPQTAELEMAMNLDAQAEDDSPSSS